MFRIARLAAATAAFAALAAPQFASAASHPTYVDRDATAGVAHVTKAGSATAKKQRPRARTANGVCTGATAPLNGRRLDVARQATLCLLNRERAQHGLSALRSSSPLQSAAWKHSRDMVQHHYFEHGAFLTRIARAGYLNGAHNYSVGENIAYGPGSWQTPAKMVDAWMHSPEHKANILSRSYREIGVGIALGTPNGYRGGTYTTDFGLRS